MLNQPIQPKNPKPGSIILVTFKNHVWAAMVTGHTVDEVLKHVQQCNRENVVCTMEVPK